MDKQWLPSKLTLKPFAICSQLLDPIFIEEFGKID
jgi:hypothetical protein